MPKIKAPKMPKMKAPKMPKMKAPRMKINTKGIGKGMKSVSKAASGAVKSYGNAVKGAAKSYVNMQKGIIKGAGKALSSVAQGLGKAGSSLMDMMNQDAASSEPEEEEQPDEESQEEELNENSEESIDSEESDFDNSDVMNEELNGFLSMIGAAAGSVVAPGVGTGIGASLGSMLEKKQKPKAKPKKQARPTRTSKPSPRRANNNSPQSRNNSNQQIFNPQQSSLPFPQQPNFNPQNIFNQLPQVVNTVREYIPQASPSYPRQNFQTPMYNQADSINRQYQKRFDDSFQSILKQNSDGSLSMSFGNDKNLWELDGELNGFWSFLGIPDKEEVTNKIVMSGAAGVAVGFLLSALINKKKRKKV